jgi:hypothetical protein
LSAFSGRFLKTINKTTAAGFGSPSFFALRAFSFSRARATGRNFALYGVFFLWGCIYIYPTPKRPARLNLAGMAHTATKRQNAARRSVPVSRTLPGFSEGGGSRAELPAIFAPRQRAYAPTRENCCKAKSVAT